MNDRITSPRFAANSPLARVRGRKGVAVAPTAAAAKAARRTFSAEEERILKQLLAEEQDFIDNKAFYVKDAEKKIYEDAADVKKPDASWYHPVMDDIGGGRARLPKTTEQVILTAAEERILFLQFNYARCQIWQIQQDIKKSETGRPTHEQCEVLLRWYRKADELREQIAETNLALVLAMAKRTRMSEVDFADLISEGNMALLRAVDKFDCERGFKFSTYACRAILKAFSRQGMKLSKYRQRFPTDFDPKLEKSNFTDTKRAEFVSDAAAEVRRIVTENRCDLSEIEKTVIEHRFRLEGANPDEKPMTLEQVGQIIGVTKERVRQIQNKAMEKIRLQLEAKFLGTLKPEQAELAAQAAGIAPLPGQTAEAKPLPLDLLLN
ncbi:MAG: sigma-70 family RNA polymerase sigma factor [Phycisphaerales bacterium]|nr:sigma-70 family RNA polymerase sigma factor [Phycisphaerales bacterium]